MRAAVLIVLFASLGCRAPVEQTPPVQVEPPAPLARSMKGWELYSWRAGDAWRFALVHGTNRGKTPHWVREKERTLDDVDALVASLRRLAPGQSVIWLARPHALREDAGDFGVPPDDVVAPVEAAAREHGLEFDVFR